MTESAMLREHGTAFMRLKASSILSAAEADLRLYEKKLRKDADPDARYSFARRHVLRARDPEHLVALAYYEPHVAEGTDKQSTLVIYGDRDLLRETLIELLAAGTRKYEPPPTDIDTTDESEPCGSSEPLDTSEPGNESEPQRS